MKALLIFVIVVLCSGFSRGSFRLQNVIGLINARSRRSFDRITSVADLEKYGIDYETVDPQIILDAFSTTPELIERHGYPAEIHRIRTPDGYLLEMHRIPKKGGIPIYLQHGILDSSAAWVLMGPNNSLAYQLSDLGYDVWMGNNRGNRYSRAHIKLKPNEKSFWDFSFHEIGVFDLPAMIDYIIESTGYSEIHYVGHSQGTTTFWVMCSERPIYCNKILSMTALAPIAYLKHTKSPVIRSIVPFLNQIEVVFKLLGIYEFMPNNDFMTLTGQFFCEKEIVTQAFCMNAIFLITGYNSEQMNKTMLPAILGHLPAGAATKQLVHYGQIIKSGKFAQFDYGFFKNILKYGSTKPAEYNLSRVKVPVALFYSKNDWLAQREDVDALEKQLPNVVKSHLIPMPKFNHLDFIFAIKCRQMVNDEVVKVIHEFENSINSL